MRALAEGLKSFSDGGGGDDRYCFDTRMHLHKVEKELVWMRWTGMIVWGAVLYLNGGFRALDVPTMAFVAGAIYTQALHRHLRYSRNMALTSRVAAGGDALLVFTMAWMHGGIHSYFIPFFYTTIIAAAFRFGARYSLGVLLLNATLLLILGARDHIAGQQVAVMLFELLFMVLSFALGMMLSNWAASNLRIAVGHAEALGQERDRSQSLLRRLIKAQEEERRVLSEDLHDRMGESLFSIGHGLDDCIASDIGQDMKVKLIDLRRKLAGCVSDVRLVINDLRPNVLDELGFLEAILEYILSIRSIVPFAIDTDLDPALADWRSRQDAMLFRLIQEAIFNARKHSGAAHLIVRLYRDADAVILEIADDGYGFDLVAVPAGHFGLQMMRERAEVSGGALTIDTAPGKGTRINVRFQV